MAARGGVSELTPFHRRPLCAENMTKQARIYIYTDTEYIYIYILCDFCLELGGLKGGRRVMGERGKGMGGGGVGYLRSRMTYEVA